MKKLSLLFFALWLVLPGATAYCFPPVMPQAPSSGAAPAVVDSTDTSTWVLLSDDQTAAALAPKTDGGLSYNAGTGVLTATGGLSAGATGFSVDADGDTTVKSLTVTRVAGSASASDFYEVPANGDNKVTVKSADSLAADYTVTLPSATGTLAILGANTFTALQTMDATAGVQVGSTGVLITSDNDGAITFLGASAGNDEDLTMNLDDTANTVVFSSSTGVTKLDFSAMNMVTTGYMDGGILVTKSTDATITVSGMTGFYVNADDDVIAFNLPADPTNKAYCFANLLYARAITVNPDDADYIVHAGTTAAAGEAYVSSGARTDQVCVVGIDTGYWLVTSERGTWAEETP
jgi:hypothetical protein